MRSEHFSGAPDPERPLMIIRLRSKHEEPEVWNRLYPQLLANRACCDEIWFSTGVGIPFLEEHERRSRLMAGYAADLRKEGIAPGLQIQATLGHSDDITAAAGAEGKNWGSFVGVNGEQCQYINCPRQPGFLEYYRRVSEIYAKWHPASVWIDDDLRLHNHRPAAEPCGCYCPYCLELFGKEEGRTYTREELVSAYAKDEALFKRWENFSIRSLCQVAQVIIETFKNISPETRFGLQHCQHLMRMPIFEALKKYSNARIGSRPGGGAYGDHIPYGIWDKACSTSMQIKDQPGYEMFYQICAEIETCPRTFASKTFQGLRLEALLYLAAGVDSLSCFIMDPALETPEWYGRELLAPLAADTACYKEYIRHNENTLPGGIGTVCTSLVSAPVLAAGLPLVGVASGFSSPAVSGKMLIAAAAENFSEKELEALFNSGCIIDGYAAMALQKRGLNSLLGGIKVELLNIPASEYYTDDPLNEGLETKYHSLLSNARFAFEVPEGMDCRILGVYKDCKGNSCGAGTVLFTSPAGGRCALLGFDGFNIHSVSSDRVRQLNRAADWVAKGTLPLVPVEPVQCAFVPRITEEGELRSVVVLNPTIGKQRAFEVILRGVPENAEAQFQIPGESWVKVPLTRKGIECKALLPPLGGWEIGWLKIDR